MHLLIVLLTHNKVARAFSRFSLVCNEDALIYHEIGKHFFFVSHSAENSMCPDLLPLILCMHEGAQGP